MANGGQVDEHIIINTIKVDEKEREKACASKGLGCLIKFQIKSILCSMVLALAFFLVVTAYVLPLGGYDAKKIWCAGTGDLGCLVTAVTTTVADVQEEQSYNPLPREFLHENINISGIDLDYGKLRLFKPHGLATHLYIEMSAYRGGPREFSIVGLTSKPIETHHNPPYTCAWVPNSGDGKAIKGRTHKVLPDWNYGKLYTVVVITCYFTEDVGVDREGGELILYASYGDQYREPERVVVLKEAKGEYNASIFDEKNFPYDYVYCGSPVYGDISPHRMREWIAYHAKLFGEKSHFILYDAGGYKGDVRKVLEPWIKLGRVTMQNVRQQEIYDAYYHNQFLVVNDCLFQSRFMAKWTFFYDIDEFINVDPHTNLRNVLSSKNDASQIIIEQVPVVTGMCLAEPSSKAERDRKWGIEKLVFRKFFKKGVHHDRKYAIQARHAEATGIHMSMNMRKGKHATMRKKSIRYYHYHATINKDEVCSTYADPKKVAPQSQVKQLDYTMAKLANSVKEYENKTIGRLVL